MQSLRLPPIASGNLEGESSVATAIEENVRNQADTTIFYHLMVPHTDAEPHLERSEPGDDR